MTKRIPRELYILRHAKSDWDSDAESDFERPLAKRGKKDAPAMGNWMSKQKFSVNYIISSPAKRAKQTVYAVAKELGVSKQDIHFEQKIYMANLTTLLQLLQRGSVKSKNVMIVGHNPGLDDLLQHLVKDPPLTESGKLLTTASLARIAMPDNWSQLERHCGTLISLTRPRDIT
ncbi:SixA phosphatase family protein [Kaarinaea lacus]